MKTLLKLTAWVVGVIVVLAMLAGVGGMLLKARMQQADTGPLEVRVTDAQRGPLTEVVAAPGTVEPLTKVEISARVSARILALPFEEGDTVAVGDVLVELDAIDIQAQLDAAQKRLEGMQASRRVEVARIAASNAGLDGTRASHAEAQRDLERQRGLRATGDVSAQAVEQAQARFDSLDAQLKSEESSVSAANISLEVTDFNIQAAEADIARIRDNLTYTTITSPIAGTVTKLNVDVGEIALMGTMNNPGTVLIEVADLSKMLVVARVDEADISTVAAGQRARVRIYAYPDDEFTGDVERVALSTGASGAGFAAGSGGVQQFFETRIVLRNAPDQVRTGLSADVEIEVVQHDDALLLPTQAVLSRPVDALAEDIRANPLVDPSRSTAIVVFRVVDGKTVVTPVRIGASDDQHIIVLEGLDAGDTVITGPFTALESIQHDTEVAASSDAE